MVKELKPNFWKNKSYDIEKISEILEEQILFELEKLSIESISNFLKSINIKTFKIFPKFINDKVDSYQIKFTIEDSNISLTKASGEFELIDDSRLCLSEMISVNFNYEDGNVTYQELGQLQSKYMDFNQNIFNLKSFYRHLEPALKFTLNENFIEILYNQDFRNFIEELD